MALDPAGTGDPAAVDTWWKACRDAGPQGALSSAVTIARRTQILPDAAR